LNGSLDSLLLCSTEQSKGLEVKAHTRKLISAVPEMNGYVTCKMTSSVTTVTGVTKFEVLN
jgi:hypothetical protein